MVVCLVFDIDDTIYIHKSSIVPYHTIRPDYQLKHQLERIPYPKFVLSNATFDHANLIVNRLDIDDQIEKIYTRDNIPEMKPSAFCYRSVTRDIAMTLYGKIPDKIIFFDDLISNLEGAKKQGWYTIWISPNYIEAHKYPFIDKSFFSVKEALNQLHF